MTTLDVDSPADDTPAGPPAPARPHRGRRLALELLAVAVATVVILVPALRLWNADLHVPFVYSQTEKDPYSYAGDAPFYLMLSQGMYEHGTYLENPSLGWPHGQQLYDLPHGADNLNLLTIKALATATGDPVAATNLFFLLTFVTVALSAYLVFRCLALSRLVAGSMALLYTFAPYHFARGTPHLLLSSYFMVPIAMLLVLRLASADPPLTDERGRPTVREHQGWAILLACAGLASTGAYYGIMTIVFLAAVAPIVAVARRRWRPLVSAALMGAAITVVMAVNLSPSFVYWAQHGRAPDVSARFATETEINGLKITQMFVPAPGHFLYPGVAARANRYSRVPSERGQQLGAVAAVGVIASMGSLFVLAFTDRRRARAAEPDALTAEDPPAPPLEIMRRNAVGIVVLCAIAVIGGLSLVLAQTPLSEIRSWNRVSIYIMFAGLFAAGYGLDRARSWLRGRRAPGWLLPTAVVAVVLLGCADQISALDVPTYARNARVWNTERDFVRGVTADLPEGASVFELPYVTFPEPGEVNRMGPYDHVRGFLHRPDLNWSWGESRNRTPNWQAALLAQPVRDQLEGLAAVGFDGILLDRYGYGDRGALAEAAYALTLGEQPQVSPDGRLSYFDLRPFAAELRERIGDDGMAELRTRTLERGPVHTK